MSRKSAALTGLSYLWALSPLLTLGLITPLTIGYAAVRMKSAWVWASLVPYFALVTFMLVPVEGEYTTTTQDALFIMALLLAGPAATIHALAIRHRVFPPRPVLPGTLQHAVLESQRRRALRAEAADIARTNPELALELGIGRPDLPRTFDDGGLIDVNHAPASAIATIPGIRPAGAELIVRRREELGGFSSAEEIAAMVSLPPHLTPVLKEHAVFLP